MTVSSEIETQIACLKAELAQSDRLLDNLVLTLAAVVQAAGGSVTVPKVALENVRSLELEKAASPDGGVIYSVKDVGQ